MQDKLSSEYLENAELTIKELRTRSNSSRSRATAILFVIITVLIFTAVFIVFAGKIAQLGTTRLDPLTEMKSERRQLAERLIQLGQQQISNVRERSRNNVQIERIRADLSRPLESSSFISEMEAQMVELVARDGELAEVKRQIDTEQKRLIDRSTDLSAKIDEARSAHFAVNMGQSVADTTGWAESVTDPVLLVAASLTRLGVLVIAIYLVQILVNLYKYNTKVCAHYLAQIDSLRLIEHGNGEELKSLHSTLFPDIEYGRQPKTIWQETKERVENTFRNKDRNSRSQSEDTGTR